MNWGQDEAERQEIFLQGVSALQFSFFDTREKEWVDTWTDTESLPPFFKLAWKHDKQVMECAFFLSDVDIPIIYPKQPGSP